MFRTLGKSKIAFVLAILFGISLFFFRGGSRYSNLFNSDNIIASVSGTSISTSKFNRVMQLNVNQYAQILGKKLTGEEIQTFQIHNIALRNLINNAVFENEFENKSFIIDESVVAQKTKERIPVPVPKSRKLEIFFFFDNHYIFLIANKVEECFPVPKAVLAGIKRKYFVEILFN